MIIDLRYHLASLVAVFFALGLGVLIGTSLAQNGGVARSQTQLIDSIESGLDRLRKENAQLSQQAGSAQRDLAAYQRYSARIFDPLAAGALDGRSVAVLTYGDPDASGALAGKVEESLRRAGADLVAFGWIDPARVGNVALGTLTHGGDVGKLKEALLNTPPEGPGAPWYRVTRDSHTPADAVVFIDAQSPTSEAATDVARTVWSALAGAAAPLSLVASGGVDWNKLIAADTKRVLVVDNVDDAVGRLALVLGIAQGRAGHFGLGPGAAGLAPDPVLGPSHG
ncbi:MAG TPA: copper transporter [Limnochordia bacterium]|nr:copper transporter [Limnochordia bacterium]